MSLFRRMDDADAQASPNAAGPLEIRRDRRRAIVAVGTLACPGCDAPVAPGRGPLAPADIIGCPYCGREGAVREFLSLNEPTRPTRVVIRVVQRAREALG